MTQAIPGLFSGFAEAYRALASRQMRVAALVLRRYAAAISKMSGIPVNQVLASPEFLFRARALSAPKDYLSRLVNFWWGKDRFCSLLEQVVSRMGGLPGFRGIRYHLRASKQRSTLQSWTQSQYKRGSTIEAIDIRGRDELTGCVEAGERISIEKEVTFAFPEDVEPCPGVRIGNSVFIATNASLSVIGRIEIGDDVVIGAYCHLAAVNHLFAVKHIPVGQQGFGVRHLTIGRGEWLGTHVVVLPGVSIGKRTIVGAGSVVTKDLPSHEVLAGVPEKKICNR